MVWEKSNAWGEKLALFVTLDNLCVLYSLCHYQLSSISPLKRSFSVWGVQVVRYCQEGFSAAIDENCYDACVQGGRLQRFLTEKRLDETCQRSLKETPRPLCHDACVQGYRSGVKDVSTALGKRMAKVRIGTHRNRLRTSCNTENDHKGRWPFA